MTADIDTDTSAARRRRWQSATAAVFISAETLKELGGAEATADLFEAIANALRAGKDFKVAHDLAGTAGHA